MRNFGGKKLDLAPALYDDKGSLVSKCFFVSYEAEVKKTFGQILQSTAEFTYMKMSYYDLQVTSGDLR